MKLEEIQSNRELREHEFPVTRQRTFLAHAGVCPLPRRVAQAIQSHTDDCTFMDQEAAFPLDRVHKVRESAARLLNASPDEISFVGPTSLALSFVAGGLPWKRGDNILVYQDDYPSNVYPWMALARNIEVRFINIRQLGRIRSIDVMGQVDEQTRLVALASCHYISGSRLPLAEIGAFLRSRNILFCVDAIQTLGAFRTSVEHVDFLAADAHKWLLGPCAAGLLYVRKAVQNRLNPVALGWHNVRCPGFVTQENLVYRTDGRRYEAGTPNLAGLAGLGAALDLIQEIGVAEIESELLRKRQWLVPRLQSKGCTVLQADAPPENASAIVSFHREGTDLVELQQRLAERQIIVSVRADRAGRTYIRLSPHFYNTDEELGRVVDAL
jgi:selenocysteine lyase/cysteine desulfurase